MRRPLGGDNFLPHRLLAVDGFGDFYDAVGLELDDAGHVVDAAVADTTRVLEIAVAVVSHGHIGVNLARVRLALLYLAVVVLDEDVVHQLDRARFDAALAQGEVDVAAAVAHRRLPFGGLRLADRIVHLDVEALLAAGVAGERYRPRAVIDRPRPRAGDITRAVVLRRLGRAVVRPRQFDGVRRKPRLQLDEHGRRRSAVGAIVDGRL